MFSRRWTRRLLLVTAVGLFAVAGPLGCKSMESKPAASKSCGDPTCDTKH